MAWAKVGSEIQPDGGPFEPAADSFETKYNAELAKGKVDNDNLSLENGWPIPTGFMEQRPSGEGEVRQMLDWLFNSRTQEMARENGNTDEELDRISKDALNWAAYFKVAITDSERNVAKRLGVNVDHLPQLPDTMLRHRSLGI